jgi:hypothetical protein
MKLLGYEDDQAEISLGLDELILLHSALDEICNGFELSEEEFESILDAPREEAEALLRRLEGVMERLNLVPDED